jgi:hypothetical protein
MVLHVEQVLEGSEAKAALLCAFAPKEREFPAESLELPRFSYSLCHCLEGSWTVRAASRHELRCDWPDVYRQNQLCHPSRPLLPECLQLRGEILSAVSEQGQWMSRTKGRLSTLLAAVINCAYCSKRPAQVMFALCRQPASSELLSRS